MKSDRLQWLDAEKGLGILLVILGHSFPPAWLVQFLFSFHIPLFFFLSGCLFEKNKQRRFLDFLSHKARSILLPYCLFYFVVYVYWFFIGNRFGDGRGLEIHRPLRGFFYSSQGALVDIFQPFWFLTCLFCVQVIFYGVNHFGAGRSKMVFLLSLSALAGYVTSGLTTTRPPFSLDTALTALTFFGAGYLRKNYFDRMSGQKTFRGLMVFSLFLGLNIFFQSKNSVVNLYANQYGNILYFYAAAFCGIYACFLLSPWIQKLKWLTFIGKNSLYYYCLHIVGLGLVKGALLFIFHIPLESTKDSIGWGIFYAVAAVAVLTPVIYLINLRSPKPALPS